MNNTLILALNGVMLYILESLPQPTGSDSECDELLYD